MSEDDKEKEKDKENIRIKMREAKRHSIAGDLLNASKSDKRKTIEAENEEKTES